jgi:hypothetical protein
MRFFSVLTALIGSAATVSALAVPRAETSKGPDGYLEVKPGTFKDLIVTKDNTLNGTYMEEESQIVPASKDDMSIMATLPLNFVNNFGGPISAYIVGFDEARRVVFVRRDGSLMYPSSGGSASPVPVGQDGRISLAAGENLNMVLPIALESARIYYAAADLTFGVVRTPIGDGLVQPAPNNPTDPSAGINWGFVELTLLPNGTLYANISYVDFVGLPLGMELTVNGGPTQTAFGVGRNAVNNICNGLNAQGVRDGRPWSRLCMAGSNGPVRVLSPTVFTDLDSQSFATYWHTYRDQVWDKYRNEPLIIDTQREFGRINCRVSGDALNCDGDNRAYFKPEAIDIWGCDRGPFGKQSGDNQVHLAVIPRLCAAFVRSTLLVSGGNVQPSLGQANYYRVEPTNHYSRIVHENEVDGKGYAFAYDDVNPSGTENASGTVSHPSPNTLRVFIGSPP